MLLSCGSLCGFSRLINFPLFLSICWIKFKNLVKIIVKESKNKLIIDRNPSTPTLRWPRVSGRGRTRSSLSGGDEHRLTPHMRLNSSSHVRLEPLLSKKFAFWEQIRSEFDFDIIRGFNMVIIFFYAKSSKISILCASDLKSVRFTMSTFDL